MIEQPMTPITLRDLTRLATEEAERLAEQIAEERFRRYQAKIGKQLSDRDQTIRELRRLLAAKEANHHD